MQLANLNKQARQLGEMAHWFISRHPLRSVLSVGCLLIAGVLEGVGIAAMLPVVRIMVSPDSGSETQVGQAVERAFEFAGIDPGAGPLLLFIVVVLTLKSLLILLAFTQVGYAAARMTRDIRTSLIDALMHARWEYFSSERTGNLTAAIGSEAQRTASAYLSLCHLTAGVIQVGVYLVMAFLVSWWATLFAALIGVLTMVVLSYFVSLSRRMGQWQNTLIRSFNHRLIEGIHAMKSIKAMAQERRLNALLSDDIEGLNQAQRGTVLAQQGLRTLQEPILVATIALGLYVMLDIWPGRFEVLFAIAFLFMQTLRRTNTLQRDYAGLVQQAPAFWFLRELTEKVHAAHEQFRGTQQPVFEHSIRFDRVSFAYAQTPVLKDISITIPANRVTAITGISGAGKTTIVDLVIGLLEPTKGAIYIDDIPLAELDIEKWRYRIGYVPQETVMFHDTVLNNITLGDPTISRERVEEALRRAEARDFVDQLDEGLDTVIGERGMRLSGGQRQRLAVARALVRQPVLLILDEATTALDPLTEAGICETLRHLSASLTILAISHQDALVQLADTVYRVENGSVSAVQGNDRATIVTG